MIIFLALLLSLSSSICIDISEKHSPITATVESMMEALTESCLTINIISTANSSDKENDDLLNELAYLVLKIGQNFIQLTKVNELKIVRNRRKYCNFILVENFAGFEQFNKKLTTELFRYDGYFVVILLNGCISEMSEIFKVFGDKQVYNADVVCADVESAFVWTFFPFSQQKCGNIEPKLLMKVNKHLTTNALKDFFPLKVEDLYGCPVKVAVAADIEPFIFVEKFDNGTFRLYGRDIEMLIVLSELINFQIDYVFIGFDGVFDDNFTATGGFRELSEGRADLLIGDYWLKENRLSVFDATNAYTIQPVAFVLPKSSKLSSLEKLIKPFSKASWMLILAGFSIGSFVIFTIRKFTSSSAQSFVFGSNNKSPYINMLIGIFGGSQRILPNTNFARFLLMMLLIKCLILRSMYQGFLFDILQKNQYHKQPQTIDEIFDQNYEIYVEKGSEDYLTGYNMFRGR